MYKTYCISYDLRKTGKDYKGLINEIQKSYSWWHRLGSTWLIYTTESADAIYNRLKSHLDSDDWILIIKVTRDYQGQLPKEDWDWINSHVQ